MNSKRKTKKSHNGTTIALIIIAALDAIFTAAMIWLFYLYQDVPDSLIVAVFGATFGECGFCTLIYKMRKGVVMKQNPITVGDITGFDDAEVLDNGVHGSDILSETEALRDSRYEELGDTGESDGSTGVHRK